MTLQDTLGSYLFAVPALELAIISKIHGPFYCRIWVLDMLVALGVLLLLGPLSGESLEIHVVNVFKQMFPKLL